jgi:uncharacterized OB-fold protein
MGNSLVSKCLRCGGTMFYDKFYCRNEQFFGMKCLNCGDVIDPVILENRALKGTRRMIPPPEKSSMNSEFMLE